MQNKYKSKIELSNFLQNQDKKDRIYNIATISSIVVLSALQAISSKKAQEGIDVFGFEFTQKEERWNMASNIFGFMLDLLAIVCLSLLVAAL